VLSEGWFATYPWDAPVVQNPVHKQRAEILMGLMARFPPGKLIDLGCGSGWFSQLAAERGWQAVAVDARERPWPDLPGVQFRTGDVRDEDLSGYDLILACGIYYHLTLSDQIDLIGKCRGIPLILDTHVSLTGDVRFGSYRGSVYDESAESLFASHGNDQSWWPTLDSLRAMLRDLGGYRTVDVSEPWYLPPDRTFITCIP